MLALSTLLFVPGSRADRFAKAGASGADMVVIDLEDAVAAEDKLSARAAAIAHVAGVADASTLWAVRINAIHTAEGMADLLALRAAPVQPAALFVPMVDSATEVAIVRRAYGDAVPPIVPLIETARGVAAAVAIAAETGVGAVMLGGGDLCAELGVPMSWDAMAHARGAIVLACAAARVPAIDVPWLGLDDEAGLVEETQRVCAMGFAAKAALHPNQVATINAIMQPSAAQIDEAEAALVAYEEGGGRAIRFRGRMLEAPIVKQYQAVLAKAGRLRHA